MKTNVKVSKKQMEIIKYMQDGFPLLIGQSETTGRQYYMIASTHNNGYGNTYFNAMVFTNLLYKGLIYQEMSPPFKYILTTLGKSIATKP